MITKKMEHTLETKITQTGDATGGKERKNFHLFILAVTKGWMGDKY
jgi:hypothetical protein